MLRQGTRHLTFRIELVRVSLGVWNWYTLLYTSQPRSPQGSLSPGNWDGATEFGALTSRRQWASNVEIRYFKSTALSLVF